ncbi:hypothetical protein [Microbulbifer sp. YPW1]|nr:hypothetical protein [Microbulbifer sp. YPW1]
MVTVGVAFEGFVLDGLLLRLGGAALRDLFVGKGGRLEGIVVAASGR